MSSTFFDVPNTHDPIFFERILIRPVLDALALEGTSGEPVNVQTLNEAQTAGSSPAPDTSKERSLPPPLGCQEQKGGIQVSKAGQRGGGEQMRHISLIPHPPPSPLPAKAESTPAYSAQGMKEAKWEEPAKEDCPLASRISNPSTDQSF